MRILILAKRYYTRHDLIADQYGRMWELPCELTRRGNEVLGICAAYRNYADKQHGAGVPTQDTPAGLSWRTIRVHPWSPWSWYRYIREIGEACVDFRPDVICGSMDAFQLICAAHIARKAGLPLALDFYDNYEAFLATRIPGVTRFLKRSVQQADLVTCVGHRLAELLRSSAYSVRGRIEVLPNAVDERFLSPPDKATARKMLGLPDDAVLIGTAGALDRTRGIECLYKAFSTLAAVDESVYLALAGKPVKTVPEHDRVIHFDEIDYTNMPAFWAALDVAVVCLADNLFGRYCAPQKAVEIAAVGTPMVFTKLGELQGAEWVQFGVGVCEQDSVKMAQAIELQLSNPEKPSRDVRTWADLAQSWEQLLENIGA